MAPRQEPGPGEPWSRRSLRILVLAAGLVSVALLTGLGLAVRYALRDHASDAERAPVVVVGHRADASAGPSPQDAIADAPLPDADPAAARPGTLTTRRIDRLVTPAATRLGPAGVPTGFPRTPAGALAQLAAIDRTAVESGTVAGAQDVIAAWAAPGGPTPETWSGVAAVAALLEAAGLPATGSPTTTIQLVPAMGLIKGSLPPPAGAPFPGSAAETPTADSRPGVRFVVPCVDFVLVVTDRTTQRAATADCQRMVWRPDPRARTGRPFLGAVPAGGRWVIGPGAEPVPAPSLWPGTDAAREAGYRTLETGGAVLR